jgi:hypothetical protein
MHYIQGRRTGQKEQQPSKANLSLFGRRFRYTFENEIAGKVKDKNNGSPQVQAKQSSLLQ